MPPPAQQQPSVVAEGAVARLETDQFRALAEDIGDPRCALDFLADYLRMLPGRMARINGYLREQDSKAAMDAVLSLKVSSAMTGAQEAEARCGVIEALLRHDRLEAAGIAARSLNRFVEGLVVNSQDVLIEARTELHRNHGISGHFWLNSCSNLDEFESRTRA